jgi:hypothetical protein
MPYDETLAKRVREYFLILPGSSEKKMFGGLCFMLRGNMCCGIVGERLMLRVDPKAYPALLQKKHVEPMTFTGKPLKGMIYVTPQGIRSAVALAHWVEIARRFIASLPAKLKKQKPASTKSS